MDVVEQIRKIDEIAKNWVQSLIEDWSKPNAGLGPNFKWEDFPKIAGNFAATEVFQLFYDDPYRYVLEEYAKFKANEHALVALKERGLI